MDNMRLYKKRTVWIKPLRQNNGFSVIELLMAVMILSLLVMAFTPLLVGSVVQIGYAGDKTEALYEGQSEMEVNIAERKTQYGNTLEFTFPDNPNVIIEVPGELVSVDIDKGEASAWLSGFIPYLPSINLTNPPLIIEGYEDKLTVTVEGRYTDLEKASAIKIYEESNPEVAKTYILNVTYKDVVNNRQTADFYLDEGLTVSDNPYIASVTWEVEGVGELTVITRFYIHRPGIVAVGEGQRIWVSPYSGSIWSERDYSKDGTGNLNDVTWTSLSTSIAIAGNGRTIVWDVNEEPKVSGPRSDLSLNSIVSGAGKHIAVGNNGKVLIADTENDLLTAEAITVDVAGGKDLHGIAWDGTKYIAVGNSGVAVQFANSEWEDVSPVTEGITEVNFKGITYGDAGWIAVGGNSYGKAVVFRLSGNNWEQIIGGLPSGADSLNDIIFDGERYFAVGNNGTLIYSEDALTWILLPLNTSYSLYAIDYGNFSDEAEGEENNGILNEIGKDYIIVGQSGAVLTTSGNGTETWVVQAGITQNIHGVALRK